jgi:hypothetical protein
MPAVMMSDWMKDNGGRGCKDDGDDGISTK